MSPLGPFNGKSFGTTISPWIVTLDALQPFECPGPKRDIPVAAYLQDPKELSHYAIKLGADLVTDVENSASTRICDSRVDWMYWTFRDMVVHQTINGCPLRSGDLLATGTVSGSKEGTNGCLLEITKGGKKPLSLKNGSERVYLQDGDAVRLVGWAGEIGTESCVGFGEAYSVLAASWA